MSVRRLLGLVSMLILVAGMLAPASPAAAAPMVFVVNSTADDTDAGGCEPSPAGDCTLREAITAANANIGPDRIEFDLGTGVPTIQVATELPTMDGQTHINGATGGATRVELSGPNTGCQDGLILNGTETSGSSIRRMVINNFDCAGIRIDFSDNNLIVGNFIGTDETGSAPGGGGNTGILLAFGADSNTIGGTARAHRNVIGDYDYGVAAGPPSSFNRIIGNLIGIGVGGVPIPNGIGVSIEQTATGNTIEENGIDNNFGLGIDIGDSGVQPNDNVDADSGSNDLQNFPVLTRADAMESETFVRGRLRTTPNTQVRVDLYSSPACDDSGYGEGAHHLASLQGTTSDIGLLYFAVNVARVRVGAVITATSTNPEGSTSEFSECETVI